MSEQDSPAESPDYFAEPVRGKGIRRLNRVAIIGIVLLALIFVAGVTYTFVDRMEEQNRKRIAEEEVKKVPTVATPTVKRPPGPDVALPPAAPAPVHFNEQGNPVPPMPQESPETSRVRQEREALIKAALQSDAAVTGFNTATAAMPPPLLSDGTVQQEREREEDYLPDGDLNRQREKKDFLNSFTSKDSVYLKQSRVAPLSPNELKAGSIIPGVMITGVNSDLPGQIVGQVRQNVYDSATGNHLLIPAGAKIVGTYDSSISAGQERVLVAWNRIIFPDSSSISLEGMPGADRSGYAGFRDKVDNHYWRTFGNAFLLSLFSAGIQLSQPRAAVQGTYNSQQIMAAELGRQLGRLGMTLTQRNLNIQPTLEIRPGFQFSIMVTKDMILPPWKG